MTLRLMNKRCKHYVYLLQDDKFRDHDIDGDNDIVKLGVCLGDNIKIIKNDSYKNIINLCKCHNPYKVEKRIREEYIETFGDLYHPDGYFLANKSFAMGIFDEIVKDMTPRHRFKSYLEQNNNLLIEFPNYKKDVSYGGNKRLIVVRWDEKIVRYIDTNNGKSIGCSFDHLCAFKGKSSLEYMMGLKDKGIISNYKQYSVVDTDLIKTINSTKTIITLYPGHAELVHRSIWEYNKHKLDVSLSTKHHIKNLLTKNGVLRCYGSREYCYCDIQPHSTQPNRWLITIDTSGALSESCNSSIIKLVKYGEYYYREGYLDNKYPGHICMPYYDVLEHDWNGWDKEKTLPIPLQDDLLSELVNRVSNLTLG